MELTEADRLFVAKVAAQAAEQDAHEALRAEGASVQTLRDFIELHDSARTAEAVFLDALLEEQRQLAATP